MPNPNFGFMGNDLSRYDEVAIPDLEVQPKSSPLQEMGVTGLKRAAGIVDEEFLPALRGRKAVKIFQEMSLNDPIVGSLLFSITQLLRNVDWRVEGTDNTPEATEAKDFLEQCMDDMSHTWDDMIADILTCLVYGWSWHEIVYKKRIGPWERDPKKKSKYTDGRIGWRKIAIRSQETMLRWIFDEDGGIKGLVQLSPPQYQSVVIPIERSLLFRTDTSKGNPEGVSILRRSYRPWFFKKRLEEFEAIGVERDLAGMPVARIPAAYMDAPAGSKERKVFEAFKKMVSNVRRDEHEGLVLPTQYDRNTKQPLFDFELLSAGGSRTFDTNALIQRYEQRILMTVLADFILVGHEGQGSYALHVDKTGIFRSALNSFANMIADVFNRHAIPRLFELNGWKLDELPKIVPNNVDPPNLTELTQFMTGMAGMGMEWFPDAELEAFLRDIAHLPALPDELMEIRRQMSQQSAVMGYADQQMQFLGMQQKAEMVGRGYTPEQAMLASEQPNDEMAEQQMGQQLRQQEGEAQMQAQYDTSLQQAEIESGQAEQNEQHAQAQHTREMELMQAQEAIAQAGLEREAAKLDMADFYKERETERGEKAATSGDKRAAIAGEREGKAKDADVKRQLALRDREDKSKDADEKRQIRIQRAKQTAKPDKKPLPTKGKK